jgi:hypothetical protein
MELQKNTDYFAPEGSDRDFFVNDVINIMQTFKVKGDGDAEFRDPEEDDLNDLYISSSIVTAGEHVMTKHFWNHEQQRNEYEYRMSEVGGDGTTASLHQIPLSDLAHVGRQDNMPDDGGMGGDGGHIPPPDGGDGGDMPPPPDDGGDVLPPPDDGGDGGDMPPPPDDGGDGGDMPPPEPPIGLAVVNFADGSIVMNDNTEEMIYDLNINGDVLSFGNDGVSYGIGYDRSAEDNVQGLVGDNTASRKLVLIPYSNRDDAMLYLAGLNAGDMVHGISVEFQADDTPADAPLVINGTSHTLNQTVQIAMLAGKFSVASTAVPPTELEFYDIELGSDDHLGTVTKSLIFFDIKNIKGIEIADYKITNNNS